ncbi:MAG: hypothetical protein ACM3H7_01600, partial [Acidobacteriaceae bacterium]
MAPILDHLIGWLNTPQGNVLYPLALGMCVAFSLVASAFAGEDLRSAERRQLQWGFSSLLLVQVLLFLASCLAWLGRLNGHLFIPPLERTIALFSLVLIIWLWVYPGLKRLESTVMIILEVIILIVGALSLVLWLAPSGSSTYTSFFLGASAFYFGLALSVLGVILLLVNRPVEWEYGLAMMAVFLLGYLAQLLLPQADGDYPWFVRLGEIAGYPFLLALPGRLRMTRPEITRDRAGSLSPRRVPQSDTQLIKT